MIEFKNPLVRVRCLECREEHFIEMKHIGTDKDQRSIGFEYEHTYRGKLKCSHCGEDMKLFKTIWEYPKGIIHYHETKNESCLVIDDIITEQLDLFVADSLPSRDSIRKIIELTAHECNGDVWGDDIPLGTMDELIDAALEILRNENPQTKN